MRKRSLCTASITCIFFIMLSRQVSALSYDLSDAVITADEGGLVIIHDDDNSDQFVNIDNLEPGYSIRRSYIIRNDYKNDYELYLRAEDAYSSYGYEDGEVISIIKLKLTLDGVVMYDGTICGCADQYAATLKENIYIGHIEGESDSRLCADFYLDGQSITNEFQDVETSVGWVWTAIIPDKTSNEGGMKDDHSQIMTKKGPRTGDTIHYALWILLAGIMLAVIRKTGRKKGST